MMGICSVLVAEVKGCNCRNLDGFKSSYGGEEFTNFGCKIRPNKGLN